MNLALSPIFTNDAITFGILMVVLALIFYTSGLDAQGWKKFYRFVPALLLCYFVPALLNYPLGLIAPHWYGDGLQSVLDQYRVVLPDGLSYDQITAYLNDAGVPAAEYKAEQGHSRLYFVASRYLLPASLILFCLSIDLKGLINLGPKSLIMFLTATVGIIIGGPIALLFISAVAPDVINADPSEVWRGLATVAGSWIGGGANQTAMKEVYNVADNLFGTMIVVDVVVANIWMGFLLYGASISDKIDKRLNADNSSIKELVTKVSDYRSKIEEIPTTPKLFMLLAIAFGGVAISHLGADIMTPLMKGKAEFLSRFYLDSLMSHFFWLIVISTTIGLTLSFTKARKLEGVGASRWGSIFIYILVATIGMKMNLGEVFDKEQPQHRSSLQHSMSRWPQWVS